MLKQQSPSVSHGAEAIPAHRPPKNIHRSLRKSISLQTEHLPLRCRHLHWGSASVAVRRRGWAPSSAPEINTQTWATAAFIIAARFICWLSYLWALRQNISSQQEEEQRVDAFVSVLLEQQGLLLMPSETTASWKGDVSVVFQQAVLDYKHLAKLEVIHTEDWPESSHNHYFPFGSFLATLQRV